MPRKTPSKRRSVKKGITVTAVTSTRGPPATTVHVEVDPTTLKSELGDFTGVKHVVAEIPDQSEGTLKWRPERMYKERSDVRRPGDPAGPPVEAYAVTHYGPSESRQRGVAVTVETEAGPVAAQERGEAYSVSEAGKPGESRKIPAPPRKQKR